eukprot:1327808-Rhodomonas_salina.1
MQEKTKEFSDRLGRGGEFYRRSITQCATAAIGVTLSASDIKSMTKADEWLAGLFKQYGRKNELEPPPFQAQPPLFFQQQLPVPSVLPPVRNTSYFGDRAPPGT